MKDHVKKDEFNIALKIDFRYPKKRLKVYMQNEKGERNM